MLGYGAMELRSALRARDIMPSRSSARRWEAIAPEADDIAGERGEIAEQGVEAVHHRERSPSAGCVRRR
jgi:hypothetical protein